MTGTRPASVPRLWVEGPLAPGADVDLPERAQRHVAALRLREGDEVLLFDGRGGEYAARLLRIRHGGVAARVLRWHDNERESPLAVTLALGISSGDRMDYAIQKATELGVAQIVPLATERSVVKLSGPRAERRLAHWRGIATASCEQSGRNRIPVVQEVADLPSFVARDRQGLALLLAPDARLRLRDLEPASTCTVLIGPEGGLSPGEHDLALRKGFTPVRFGPRVLRTETAPLAAIAALQAMWGDC